MAFPAAIFIKKFSYKSGILLGLALYATGAFLFFPAKMTGNYYPFLVAYFILTCGLSFLETSANPYILTMGPEENATRRLNLAQAFNPIGSLLGMFVAMNYIQARLNPMSTAERALLSDSEFEAMKQSDLSILISPYLAIGLVVLLMFLIILITKMPKHADKDKTLDFWATIKRIFSIPNYRQGVIAQFLLRGRADHVLDLYHTVRYPCLHGRGDGGAGGRSALPEIQHLGDDTLLHKPLYRYLPDEVL